jgi:hypothetical protein
MDGGTITIMGTTASDRLISLPWMAEVRPWDTGSGPVIGGSDPLQAG